MRPVSGAWPTEETFRGKTILIVEDDVDFCEILASAFTEFGAKTLTAGNVQEAQREIVARRADLILSDLALPGETGLDLIRWLRSMPEALGRDTPCIAMTGYSSTYPPTGATGFDAYLRKPVEIDRLCRLVAGVLAVRPPRDQAP
jgi:CheY-like chemotaxis protein